ncbi:MAG: alpha/beta fold hydrolase [Candidatus Limnocylindria bacterium]
MLQKVTSADGTNIAYEPGGSGPPLVIVNGALGDRRSAARLRPLLEPSFTVIAYDRRGRGASGDAATYAPEREIEDLRAVCGRLTALPVVYGHSSGGILALQAALHGLPMAALALYEPPYILPGSRIPPGADLPDRIVRLLAAGGRGEGLRLFLDEGVQLPEPVVDDLEASPGWPPMLALAHTVPYDLRVTGDGAIPVDRLRDLHVPTLVLSGGASPRWMRDSVAALASAIPGSSYQVVPGQTHAPPPELLAPRLEAFFAAPTLSAG